MRFLLIIVMFLLSCSSSNSGETFEEKEIIQANEFNNFVKF